MHGKTSTVQREVLLRNRYAMWVFSHRQTGDCSDYRMAVTGSYDSVNTVDHRSAGRSTLRRGWPVGYCGSAGPWADATAAVAQDSVASSWH